MKYTLILIGACVLWFAQGCKEDSVETNNPYSNQGELDEHDRVRGDTADVDTGTIQWLQKFVFAPTCANSGCHDGTFEPDFRTTTSSYNTLVKRPPIKQDAVDPLMYRVVPGDAARSMLVRRLEEDLNGNSGVMPLALEPGSDWREEKEFYIQQIKNWINNGARNMDGLTPDEVDLPPDYKGFAVYINGTERPRANERTPIAVPAGTSNLEIRFAIDDDKTAPANYSTLQYAFTQDITQFDSIDWDPLQVDQTGKTFTGYYGDEVTSYFKANVDVSSYPSGEVLWFRARVSDGTNEKDLPNDQSLFNIKLNATIKLQ